MVLCQVLFQLLFQHTEHDFTAPSIIENDCQVVFVWLTNDIVSTATEKVVHVELGKACEPCGIHALSARGNYLCVDVRSRYLNLCHLWFPSYTTMLQHILDFVNTYFTINVTSISWGIVISQSILPLTV